MPLAAPTLPARYRNPRSIGRGGMGEIYRATDVVLQREVAVKVLALPDEDARRRFTREALAVARLSDGPNVISIYDVGELDGHPFLVMEYLAGGSLAQRIAARDYSRSQALDWLEQAARALDFAHRHGVVHRDVKPANLLLDASGTVHVADFGIARTDGLEAHTQTGVALGTLGYLAPEQARGRRATAASDRYALAVVAGELLAASPSEELSAGQPAPLVAVLSRGLASNPSDRFPSCAELVAALRAALEGDDAPTVVIRRRPSRHTLALVAGALGLGGLGTALAMGFTAEGGTERPRPPTRPIVLVRTVTDVRATTVSPATTDAALAADDPVAEDEHGKRPEKIHGHGKGGKKGKG